MPNKARLNTRHLPQLLLAQQLHCGRGKNFCRSAKSELAGRVLARLRKLISEKSVVSVVYDGDIKIVEPYLVYESKDGNRLLHGWQQSGTSKKTPPPDWANLSLAKITSITPTGAKFKQPRPDYNPFSGLFHHVLFHTHVREVKVFSKIGPTKRKSLNRTIE